jgi:hypothetical protein
MLATVHKVLIGSGIGLGLVFGTYSVVHEGWVAAGASAVMTVGLSLYLRWFVKKNA